MNKKTILLHSCCAPCSAAVLEWLVDNDYKPILFYYNPNIHPQEEYEKRKNELTGYAVKKKMEVIDGDDVHEWQRQHSQWQQAVKGYESEPERGVRCLRCFKMRLDKTAETASQLGIEQFATTLASSRWKDLSQISQAGHEAAAKYERLTFFDKNWRKDGLQQRRNELLKENNFYNQQYCGCEYSARRLSEERETVVEPADDGAVKVIQ